MTPLQIKQQKFSELSSVMQPELMKIQKNIRIKKIRFLCRKCRKNLSRISEIWSITYRKLCTAFGAADVVSVACYPEYSCYVGSVKSVLDGVASQIIGISGYTNILQDFITTTMTRVRLILDGSTATSNLSY